MTSHEIFHHMPPALATQIFSWLHTEQKPVYKAAIQGLANQRKLRPVFVERKPPDERHAWLQQALSRPVSNGVASHVLQAWLLGANKPMLCDFLDALQIQHDEDGTVETIPAAPPKEKIASAIDQLLQKYPPQSVAVYLHAFRDMDSTVQWPPLDELLREKPELQLGG